MINALVVLAAAQNNPSSKWELKTVEFFKEKLKEKDAHTWVMQLWVPSSLEFRRDKWDACKQSAWARKWQPPSFPCRSHLWTMSLCTTWSPTAWWSSVAWSKTCLIQSSTWACTRLLTHLRRLRLPLHSSLPCPPQALCMWRRVRCCLLIILFCSLNAPQALRCGKYKDVTECGVSPPPPNPSRGP